MKKWIILAFLLVTAASLGLPTIPNTTAQDDDSSATFEVARCINIGNALEAPREGDWGLIVEEAWFSAIAEAGFDTVRIPVRWSNHAATDAPYSIDPDFWTRVDEVIGWALDADLGVILNVHHYNEIMAEPSAHEARLSAIWEQLATHYREYPPTLALEVLNEPNDALSQDLWNPMMARLINIIREIDAERTLIVGGSPWNSLDSLNSLELPDDTSNLIATFHSYEPFEFTHQGAEWVDGSGAWIGRTWGSGEDYLAMEDYFKRAEEWRAEKGLPLLMGEFGAYSVAAMEERVEWTTAMVLNAEARGIGWCYWEFASGFGAYNPYIDRWKPELLGALIIED